MKTEHDDFSDYIVDLCGNIAVWLLVGVVIAYLTLLILEFCGVLK